MINLIGCGSSSCKAKNLGLIVAGLMGLATAKGFSQEAVNTYTGADGTTYYYYNSGGEMGWQKDGTLYLSGQSGSPAPISGGYTESLDERINSVFVNSTNDINIYRITLHEDHLREILRYNSMDKRVTPERNGEYFKGREMLLKNLTSYMVSYNHEPTTSPILNPETVRAYMNDDFFVNREVFSAMPNLVIDVYEQIANMYYNKARALPKDSTEQRAAYLECARFAYEEPVSRFGETEWLGKMNRSEMDYLDHMKTIYVKLDNIPRAREIYNVMLKFVK